MQKNNLRYKTLLLILPFMIIGCFQNVSKDYWKPVFQNDINGLSLFGDKAELINAVKKGSPVRVSWGQTMPDGKICIEFAEANFITVNNNDIVVQLKKALIQTDYLNPDKSLLKTNPPLEWNAIMSTDGHYHQFHSELGSGKIAKEIFMRANMCWYINSSREDSDFNTVLLDSPDGIILDSLKNL